MIESAADKILVEKCLSGNSRAFTELVEKYQLQMYRTALGIVGDVETAKDVTQSAFIKSWEKIDSYNPKYKFYSWLYRIVVNEALNTIRAKKDHQELINQQSASANPYETLVSKEKKQKLLDALASLTTDYRIVIHLRHFEELSYSEIAETLDIEVKTVKSRLYSARMELRNKLVSKD